MNNLESILKDKIVKTSSVGGGSIANSQKVVTKSGKEYFIKSYFGTNNKILVNEVNGLKEIQKSKAIKTPDIIHFDESV